jgi:hypothetical protein
MFLVTAPMKTSMPFLTAFSPETPPFSRACYLINLVRSCGSRGKRRCLFVDDFPVLKTVPDRMDHCLVDVHEVTSWDTCCGFY